MYKDRFSALFFICLGLFLILFLIPNQIENVEGGSLSPKDFPEILSYALILFGAVQLCFPVEAEDGMTRNPLGVLFIFAIISTVISISFYLKFVYLSPILAFVLMRFMNEKRWIWYLVGCGGIPLMIWFCVGVLLERPLV